MPNTTLKVLLAPELDRAAAAKSLSDFRTLHRKLAEMKVDWSEIQKHSTASLTQLNNISNAAKEFTKSLSGGTRDAMKSLTELGDQLGAAHQAAEGLAAEYRAAKGEKAKTAVTMKMKEQADIIKDLNVKLEKSKTGFKNHLLKLDEVSKSYGKLSKAAEFGGKDFIKGLADSFKAGGPSAIAKGLLSTIGKGAASGATRQAGLGPGGAGIAQTSGAMAEAIAMIAKFLPVLSIAVSGFTALWQVISAASDHMTKLNKALIDGTGTANDFSTGAKVYTKTIDDLRQASIGAAGGLLKYGATSETAAQVINKFTVESTGSLIKTRGVLAGMGDDLSKSVEKFTVSAISYGKALGMEATEVASMMGKLVSESGYAAEDVQALMGNVVKAAATANMPMTKFMGIFRSVLPDTELYQNRLEELTGTIKLLSRTMSPKDVQNFMDAFAKGFKGVDFKQRLKTVLISGTGFVSETLGKDFEMKAKVMAKNFEKYGIKPEKFKTAMKGGTAEMAKVIAEARGNAARGGGTQISANDISNAMKTASYEAARKKGGPLNMATAMRGAGEYATYKILQKQSQAFTKGFDGLSEHVIQMTGITEQQYEALRTTSQSMEAQRAELQMYGKTSSKSMNEGLRQAIASRKQGEVTSDDMVNATEEDLFMAAEISNQIKKGDKTDATAMGLAAEQVDATLSVSDKISNVLAFLLEKLYNVLQPILDVINDLWSWITGNDDQKKALDAIQQNTKQFAKDMGQKDPVAVEQVRLLGDTLQEAVKAGKTGKELKAAAWEYLPDTDALQKLTPEDLTKAMMAGGMGADTAKEQVKVVQEALKNNEVTKALDLITNNTDPKATSDALMELTKVSASKGLGIRQEARDIAGGKAATERKGGIRSVRRGRVAEDAAVEEAGDAERDMTPLNPTVSGPDKRSEMVRGKVEVKAGKQAELARGKVDVKNTTIKESEKSTKEITQTAEDQTTAIIKSTDETTKQVKSMAGDIDKGITLSNSWAKRILYGVIKDSTLESFRTALLEFAVVQAKMAEDPAFQAAMANQGGIMASEGGTIQDVSQFLTPDYFQDWISKNEKVAAQEAAGKPKALGGPIPQTGPYMLHQGEYVTPAGGGSSGSTYNVTINGTDMSPQQLQSAVFGALDSIARRH